MDKKNNTIEYLKSFYIKDYLYMAFAIVIYFDQICYRHRCFYYYISGKFDALSTCLPFFRQDFCDQYSHRSRLAYLGGEDRGDLPDPILYGESADT